MSVKLTVDFAVCGNLETIKQHGEFCDDAAERWISEVSNALQALPFAGRVRIERHFSDWHGGRFSSARAEWFGHVVVTNVTGEFELGDGSTETDTMPWCDIPEETRSEFEQLIWAAVDKADKARDEVQKVTNESDAEWERVRDADTE